MNFDKQVKLAKDKKLQNRITRDIVFLILGLFFLTISIISTINKKNDEKNIKYETTKITTKVNK